MGTPSIRTVRQLLVTAFFICVGISFLRHWLALSGTPFYPWRYALVALGTVVCIGSVVAIVWLLRMPGKSWIILVGAGITVLSFQLFSNSEGRSPITAPEFSQQDTFYRLVLGPVSDSAMYLIAMALAFHVAQGAISVRLAEQREQDRKHTEKVLGEKQHFLEQLLDSHERDRQLIAYEIHDGFVQDLTGAVMHMEAGQHKQGTMAVEAKEECERAVNLIRGAIDEARRLISGLRPPILDEQGSVAAIEYLIQEHTMSNGPPVEFHYDNETERLSPLLEGVAFRTTQEALTNIRRHAEAEHVEITLTSVNDLLKLSIRDDGQGFVPDDSRSKSFGIRGMRERAEAVRGSLEVDSTPGKGTTIKVELPLLDATQAEALKRRKAEQALYESEVRLQAVLDNTTAVIYQKDAKGKYELVNTRFEKLFNLSSEEILGKDDFEIFPRNEAEAFRRNDMQVLATGEPIEFEEMVPQGDGVHTYISIKFPLFDSEGKPKSVCGVSTDITKRKREEEDLQKAHDELEQRVMERTRDLSETNEQLGLEVEERKRVEMELRLGQSKLSEQMAVLMQLNSGQTFGRGELSATLAEITEAAAKTLGCHRVNVWLLDNKSNTLNCIEHFDQDNNEHEVGFQLTSDDYPNYFAAVAQERTIAADNAAEDPRTREFAKEYLSKHGISSMLDAAIHLHGELVGVVCHEHVGPPRHWSVEEQNFAGSVADFVALALDADKLKRTEDALRVSEHQFRHAFADGPLGMYFTDDRGQIFDSNHRLSQLLGYPKDELQDSNIFDYLHPDDTNNCRQRTTSQFAGELPVFTIEQRFLTKDEQVIWVRHTASLIERTEDGELPLQLSMIEDVTAHRRALDALQAAHEELEERVEKRTADLTAANERLKAEIEERQLAEVELEKSDYRFKELIANAPAGVFMTNAETGECTYTNPALRNISGLSEEEALGHGWYSVIHPEDREWVIPATEKSRISGVPFDEIFRIQRKDGTTRYIRANSARLPAADGKSTLNIGMVLDVTNQKLAEQELADSESRYRALLGAVPDLIIRLDRRGNCLDFFPSDTFETNFPPEAYIGKNMFEAVPPEIANWCRNAVRQALESEDTHCEEIVLDHETPPRSYEVRIRTSGTDEVLAIVRDTSPHRVPARRDSASEQEA